MANLPTTDGEGQNVQAIMTDGPPFPGPRFDMNNASKYKARPDDMLLCAYPRSGTHWIHEIVRFLFAGTTELPHHDKENVMIEMASPSSIDELPSPRRLNTHFQFDKMSPEFLQHKCKVIYVTRNPRDRCVSSYKQRRKRPEFKGEWKDFLEQNNQGKMFGTWFDYTKGWEQGMKENPNHPFLVMSYEAMKQDLLKEVRRISEFLGLKHTEDFLVEVVQKTEFDAMAARMAEVVKTATTEEERRGAEHACVKGVVGDWKNWFTVAQSEIFEEEFEREMSGTDALKLYSLKQ